MMPEGNPESSLQEARQRYGLPDASSLEEIATIVTRERWRQRAQNVGLDPDASSLDEIKQALLRQHRRERSDHDAAA